MALQTVKKTAAIHYDPLSINADIEVISGNPVQVFNREIQEYVPDRSLVPLILLPSIYAIDPHGLQTGKQAITGVEWYEGTPKKDGSNRIINNTDYEVGDGKVAGFPKFALKCKKNVSPDKPIEIFAIAIFSDIRRNIEVRVERSRKLYTAHYDLLNYSVKIDQPKGWTINPLTETPDAEGRWLHTIEAQLYSGKLPVADSNAAYWWEILENGVWRTIDNNDQLVWIDCKDASGNFTKKLTFDARMIEKSISFRAKAAYYEGARPSAAKSEELHAITSVKIEMPHSIDADFCQLKGARMDINLSTPVKYEAIISYNKGVIPDNKYNLFQVKWYGKSDKVGAVEKYIGIGRTIEFTPSALGFERGYAVVVRASVEVYSHHSLVVMPNSVPGGEPSVLTSNGVPVIQPVYV